MLILLNILCLFPGCIGDSYNPISITNSTGDTIIVQLNENINFSTDKEKSSTTSDGLSIYKLLPLESFNIGHAINELDNDIPFSEIRVICKNDTLFTNSGNAKTLFDKTIFGGIKSPYNISIK
jgi:hypothetical protein